MLAIDWAVTKELRASWATDMSGWRSRTVSAVYCKAVSPSGRSNSSRRGVALPEAAFSLPVTIVILRPFMRAIPGELEDAATVDGATRIRFFVRILLPLSRPALITVGILAFVTSWNTYMLPLIVLSTPSHFTLPLAVAMFQSQYSTDTARVFAYTALSMLPALSIFVFAQRYLVGGLVGAIRG